MQSLSDPTLFHQACLIGADWVEAKNSAVITVTTPETGNTLGHVPKMGRVEVAQAIDVAEDAFRGWSATDPKTRSKLIRRWYDLVEANASDLGRILSAEQGKPWAEGIGEIHYAATFLDWFSEEAKRFYGEVIPHTANNRRFMVLKQPVGVAALITPWNFPAAMITRKAGAALAAGCTVVIKPASATPFTALALADIALRAGIPPGVVNVVTGAAGEVGAELTENTKVRKLSFTGSTEVGRILLAQCAATVKNVSMELGGNAPVIVFDDADLEAAVQGTMASKFRNAGQTCVCANRIYVQDGIYDAFAEQLTARVKALRVGPTFDEGVEIGPLIDDAAVEKVQEHIDDAVSKGGTILTGGGLDSRGGTYFTPTVISNTPRDAKVLVEETFGPLAALVRFSEENEAIQMANDTEFGLASYVFTNDLNRSWRVIEALEYGIVGLNEGATSTEVGPFGGVKQSGIGREGSRYGIEDYLEEKFVSIGNVK
ncbi:NAD-dependent succinate-semialdehyde dehydrogenase [Arenibacterium halophilum]|uniref:NAD-dependent succinate-semialdehyde dehydrogenase n=1 Tax=Arenibacterium halophilum TaxID=2583821 RepID=A0ABY2X0H2_9RHOB|nr:NAD-dependent succinate-semialdehyde dehydrogenase [Arenibacterium halophilum]TMV08311.1 NAD-dependent succinate-semialdehyde dehydrogenase [Arenibacterium halophilum]